MSASLYQQYVQAKAEHPGKYARDLATLMGISEAELTHSRVGHDAKRLQSDARALLAALESVGEVKAITRNTYAVHEQVGRYENQHLNGHAGLILNPRALDLRLFLNQWASAFTLSEETRHGVRHSIQFFDHQGDALHKVYVTEQTDMSAWEALLAQFIIPENPVLQLEPLSTPEAVEPTADDAAVDSEWRAMTDVHQFFQLLKRNNLTRQQAFRAVGDDLAYQVDNNSLTQLLHIAQQDQNEIMIFVGNRGCVQIFTGLIEKVTPHNEWINVFNQRFTLHLIETAIAESWITRKPTKDGFVTSLELFAADGTQLAQLYGQRTEGQPEQNQWREQIARLTNKDIAA
ncbi:hemin-degrading factor [Yersinia similis]|uniref:Hemin transport protein n=1 Tax=Yersinia similis TaxID=367190 RepID=A0A0T9R4Z9_9GAMM|nr:hemin-degrading factor [Yersinia similis]CNC44810.1 hemin transport protein [Yersinia similis]CNF23975.1 hemin transport protein [Yersinia similis]CNG26382.1 hemin transport protein [Yersinia similis]CNI42499.1 hemin transport protein [Yersinia similis]